jgi:hypothetical protein
MLTLYSYPELFGVADNNPFGLKVFAFFKLTRLPFRHAHIFDAKAAPRGQLPYLDDDGHHVRRLASDPRPALPCCPRHRDGHFGGASLSHRVARSFQRWLGHRSITSTAVYTALASNRFKDFWRE